MVKVIIEGGGNTRAEQSPLRRSFQALFKQVRPRKDEPEIICGGSRGQAFEDFKKALSDNPTTAVLLLVDSECAVKSPEASPWVHVKQRKGDGWTRPEKVTDDQLHFMVETMETWLVADPDALATYYGNGFKRDKLPKRKDLEDVSQIDVANALSAATASAKTKGKYDKAHGFDLVGKVDPNKVRSAGFFAERFFSKLESL